jgi:hypothetical protein
MITQARAEEIRTKCQELAKHGPWSDQLDKVITPEEDKEIRDLWATMPGNTAYIHAFYRFINGTAYDPIQ